MGEWVGARVQTEDEIGYLSSVTLHLVFETGSLTEPLAHYFV